MADVPICPATLPALSLPNYGITPGTPYTSTSMDSGRTRQRRRFTRVPPAVDVSWVLSVDQYAVFEAFLEYDIGLGTDWFRVEVLNGIGVSEVYAQFSGSPPFKTALENNDPGWFRVTATLNIKRLPIMTLDQYGMAKQYTSAEISVLDDALHTLVHVHLPGPGRWN